MSFVPNSGPLNASVINAVFSLGEDFNLYHGTQWYYPGNLTNGNFNTNTLKLSDFYGKQPNDPATSGAYFSNTAGSSSFTVPLYRNTLTIEIWGAGGGGGGGNGGTGSNGGDSSGLGITVGGGGGGQPGAVPTPPPVQIQGGGPTGGHDPVSSPGYYSGYGGYGDNGGGNNVTGSGPGGTIQDCLIPTALISMEDGTFKEVQQLKIGDKVKSLNGKFNTIIGITSPVVNTNLVKFNDLDYFFTETHPLLTDKGWGTFNLELFKKNKSEEYEKIVVDNGGKDLIQIVETVKLAKVVDGLVEFSEITNIEFKEVENFTVYRLSVDGDNTYISENHISHNKPI